MDEVGRIYPSQKCPFPIHVVAREKQIMEEHHLPWLQWTNRSTISSLKKQSSHWRHDNGIQLSSASRIMSPILSASTADDCPLHIRIGDEDVEENKHVDEADNDNDSRHGSGSSGSGSGGSQWNGVRLTLDDLLLTSPSSKGKKHLHFYASLPS